MRLVGRLPVDADRARGRPTARNRCAARMKRAHHSHLSRRCQSRSSWSAMAIPLTLQRRQGGEWAVRRRTGEAPLATTGRRRRSGSSIAGAGGPYSSAARPSAGTIRKPRRRSTTGSRSAFSENRDARAAGIAVAPRRVAQASSAATLSAMSSRSSTGPASSQPMASAKPAGQSGRSRQRDHVRRRQARHRLAVLQRPIAGPASRPRAASAVPGGTGRSGRPSRRSPSARRAIAGTDCRLRRRRSGRAPRSAGAAAREIPAVAIRDRPRRAMAPDRAFTLSSTKRCSLMRSRSRWAPSRNSLSST